MDGKALAMLVKFCGMFGSDHVGERANAAKLANDLVRRHGLRWSDVIGGVPATRTAPPPPPPQNDDDWRWDIANECRAMVNECLEHDVWSDREAEFLESMLDWGQPTEKQLAWLKRLYARI